MSVSLSALFERAAPVLTARWDAQRAGAEPPPPDAGRLADLRAWLEIVLVSRDALESHRRLLRERMPPGGAGPGGVPPALINLAVQSGLAALGDDALLTLAQEEEALTYLLGVIQQQLPPAWLGVMAHAGGMLAEEHGAPLSLPVAAGAPELAVDDLDIDCAFTWEATASPRPLAAGAPRLVEKVPEVVQQWLRALFGSASAVSTSLGEARAQVRAWFERILVSRDALHAHIRLLQQLRQASAPGQPGPADEPEGEILFAGASVLDDTTMASLLLSPASLYELHDQITETLPAAWLEVMAREGQALAREHGVSLDSPGRDR